LFYNQLFKNRAFQAPLSGEAEERVAGAASPGESSPSRDMDHRPFIGSIKTLVNQI
jgi:hypothetical protein